MALAPSLKKNPPHHHHQSPKMMSKLRSDPSKKKTHVFLVSSLIGRKKTNGVSGVLGVELSVGPSLELEVAEGLLEVETTEAVAAATVEEWEEAGIGSGVAVVVTEDGTVEVGGKQGSKRRL